MPSVAPIPSTAVLAAIRHQLPGRPFLNVEDRGLWVRHNSWSQNLALLQSHRPSLVSGALPGALYLLPDGGWHVTKIMDLHDVLYWDPAWDLAGLKYSVFRRPLAPDLWAAFNMKYGRVPGEKRLRLYRLIRHLDAEMGNYEAPRAGARALESVRVGVVLASPGRSRNRGARCVAKRRCSS